MSLIFNSNFEDGHYFQNESYNQIVEMDQSFFPCPWRLSDWADLSAQKHYYICHIEAEKGRVGAFSLFQLGLGQPHHLLKIITHPNNLRQGLSSTLLKMATAELLTLDKASQGVILEVAAANIAAHSFYIKQGFRNLRELPGHYSDGGAAIAMILSL